MTENFEENAKKLDSKIKTLGKDAKAAFVIAAVCVCVSAISVFALGIEYELVKFLTVSEWWNNHMPDSLLYMAPFAIVSLVACVATTAGALGGGIGMLVWGRKSLRAHFEKASLEMVERKHETPN